MATAILPHEAQAPRFVWSQFLGLTLICALVIFLGLRIIMMQTPSQPLLIHHFKEPQFGQMILLVLIVSSFVFSVTFLSVAVMPNVGPYTQPAGRWLVLAVVLVIPLTVFFAVGSTSNDPSAKIPFTGTRLLELVVSVPATLQDPVKSQEALAATLLVFMAFNLSTAVVTSNLTTSLRDCTQKQIENIKTFLFWMYGVFGVIVLIYSALLYKTMFASKTSATAHSFSISRALSLLLPC